MNDKRHVVVAMSGGVDSTVAAAILVEQGYQVSGVMLRLWETEAEQLVNSTKYSQAFQDAANVCKYLGIPFYFYDVKDKFHEWVIENFIDGYLSGITPNPCIVCNRKIKWGSLLDYSLNTGADYLATGHYARTLVSSDGKVQLLRGIDESKDQAYMLSTLSQEQLSRTLFPLGNMLKSDVRKKAIELKLPVVDREESQDLCFLVGEDYRIFLKRSGIGSSFPGNIINRSGVVLGEHQGLSLFTIGQRKGLGITGSEPYYVIEKNIKTNVLVVGVESELGKSVLIARDVNWISGVPILTPIRAEVKIRYRANFSKATIVPEAQDQVRINFDNPLRDITPGQRAVFYQGEVVLGSGEIEK